MKGINISGFSDEISNSFDEQLETVKSLGMNYISIRGLDGRNIVDYSVDEMKSYIIPKLDKYGIKVSSIGSPIGKVFIDDEEGYERQLVELEKLIEFCELLDCKYIRMFSFYIPKGKQPEDYKKDVIKKLKSYVKIASKGNVILLHENEKDIYGDTDVHVKEIMDDVNSPYFKAIFDFANYVQVDVDPVHAYELLKNDIEYIHIKDANHSDKETTVCGTGDGKIYEILNDAISKGYQGFLTLEPHLVVFDSLKDLELEEVENIITVDRNLTGPEAYKLQYESLLELLEKIKKNGGIQ